jgi:hypothetical protein
VQPVVAEAARAVGVGERHHHDVADLERANIRADGLDDTDRLVAHAATTLDRPHLLVRPQIAAADTGAGYADHRIGRSDDGGVGDVLDTDVAGAVHDSSTHGGFTSGFRRPA